MSVLVKGWSIPTNGCCDCHFRTGKYCGILDKNERVLEHAERYTRPSNCPLVEVPTPHGRLIDADKEKAEIDKMLVQGEVFTTAKIFTSTVLENAPTVIEAEE